MKKIFLGFILLLSQQASTVVAETMPSTERKSKEIAIIKTVGGIILTTAGLIHGTLTGPVLIYDFGNFKGGIAVSTIALTFAYFGYKTAQNGIKDLKEIAQYPNNLNYEK